MNRFLKMAALNDDVQLYPHQERAVNRSGDSLVIAHTVGAGKTLTGIARFEKLKEEGQANKALVIVPSSLRHNFAEQGVNRFTNSTAQIVGGVSERKKGVNNDIDPNADYNIISYEMFRRDPEGYLKRSGADTIIADEFHKNKNEGTSTTESLKGLKGDYKNFIGLTGSVISNSLSDVQPLVDISTGGEHILGETKKDFDNRYLKRSKSKKYQGLAENRKPVVGFKHERALRSELGGAVDYVDYNDIKELAKMPGKNTQLHKVPLTRPEAKDYKRMVKNDPALMKMVTNRRLETLKDEEMAKSFNKMIEARKLMNSRATVNPGLSLSESARITSKTNRFLDDLEKHLDETPDGQAALFSHLIHGGHDVLEQGLKDRGIEYGKFLGKAKANGVTEESRQQDVRDYLDAKKRVMLISSAGGEGVSLNNTTYEGVLDGHYNPEKMNQMEARGVRSGGLAHRAPEDREVAINRYMATMPKTFGLFNSKFQTPDEIVYAIAENKDRNNQMMYKLLKEEQQKTEKRAGETMNRFLDKQANYQYYGLKADGTSEQIKEDDELYAKSVATSEAANRSNDSLIAHGKMNQENDKELKTTTRIGLGTGLVGGALAGAGVGRLLKNKGAGERAQNFAAVGTGIAGMVGGGFAGNVPVRRKQEEQERNHFRQEVIPQRGDFFKTLADTNKAYNERGYEGTRIAKQASESNRFLDKQASEERSIGKRVNDVIDKRVKEMENKQANRFLNKQAGNLEEALQEEQGLSDAAKVGIGSGILGVGVGGYGGYSYGASKASAETHPLIEQEIKGQLSQKYEGMISPRDYKEALEQKERLGAEIKRVSREANLLDPTDPKWEVKNGFLMKRMDQLGEEYNRAAAPIDNLTDMMRADMNSPAVAKYRDEALRKASLRKGIPYGAAGALAGGAILGGLNYLNEKKASDENRFLDKLANDVTEWQKARNEMFSIAGEMEALRKQDPDAHQTRAAELERTRHYENLYNRVYNSPDSKQHYVADVKGDHSQAKKGRNRFFDKQASDREHFGIRDGKAEAITDRTLLRAREEAENTGEMYKHKQRELGNVQQENKEGRDALSSIGAIGSGFLAARYAPGLANKVAPEVFERAFTKRPLLSSFALTTPAVLAGGVAGDSLGERIGDSREERFKEQELQPAYETYDKADQDYHDKIQDAGYQMVMSGGRGKYASEGNRFLSKQANEDERSKPKDAALAGAAIGGATLGTLGGSLGGITLQDIQHDEHMNGARKELWAKYDSERENLLFTPEGQREHAIQHSKAIGYPRDHPHFVGRQAQAHKLGTGIGAVGGLLAGAGAGSLIGFGGAKLSEYRANKAAEEKQASEGNRFLSK